MKYLLLFISLSLYANTQMCKAYNVNGQKIIETKIRFHTWLRIDQVLISFLSNSNDSTLVLDCSSDEDKYDYYCVGHSLEAGTKTVFKTKKNRGKLSIYNRRGSKIRKYKMYCD